jgi:hypothetical protein
VLGIHELFVPTSCFRKTPSRRCRVFAHDVAVACLKVTISISPL